MRDLNEPATKEKAMPNILEQTAAKAAGKVGAIKAAMSGLDGVFRQLAEEHKEVATLLSAAVLISDPEKRVAAWSKIRRDLAAHEHGELEVVYPEFEMHASLMDIVREHEDEVDHLEALISNVDSAPIASVQWETSLKQLQSAVLRHASREEREFFPRAQGVIGERRVEELEDQYLASKEAMLQNI
jgi:hemerythrin superfamily protein